jgi:hypothetical protein
MLPSVIGSMANRSGACVSASDQDFEHLPPFGVILIPPVESRSTNPRTSIMVTVAWRP